MHIKVSLSNRVREQQNLNYLHNEQFYNQKEQKLKISQKPNHTDRRNIQQSKNNGLPNGYQLKLRITINLKKTGIKVWAYICTVSF